MPKPRLLSLNTYHYRRGGSDVAFLENDRLFAGLGWDTAVFAMQHPNNEPSEWSGYFADELELGFDYSLPRKALMATKIVYSFEARQKLARLLADWRPDIAHAHCVYHHLSPSVLSLLKAQGIPTVMTAHDLKIACPAYKMYNAKGLCERCKHGNLLNVARHRCIHGSLVLSALIMVESMVHRMLGLYRNNLDRVIVPSRFYGEKLAEWGWSRDKLVHIPNFIDASRFQAQYEPGDYFLYFGRLAPEKGIDTLIRAAATTGARLRIAGTGPAGDSLRLLAADQPRIEFLGHCTGEALWRLVRGARAVVLPSQWYENAPISVLEAYASGKPVIGSRMGGIAEMIRDGETGALFDPGDADALAATLGRFESAPAGTVGEMGRRARRYVEAEFTKTRYVRDTVALYASLGVNSPAQAAPAPVEGRT